MDEKRRCSWAGDVPVYVDYHDNEWGKPTHDDRMLFELLVLEGAQAGLSWLTILKKREAYREGGALRRGEGRRAYDERGDRAQPPQDRRGHN